MHIQFDIGIEFFAVLNLDNSPIKVSSAARLLSVSIRIICWLSGLGLLKYGQVQAIYRLDGHPIWTLLAASRLQINSFSVQLFLNPNSS